MIRTLNRALISLVALVGFAGAAQAAYIPATWTDDVPGNRNISPGHSYSYTHNLNDNGFNVGSDFIESFSLSIDLFDDGDRWSEKAFVDIPGVLGDRVVLDFGNNAYNGWSVVGWAELNLFGTLSVTISSVCNILDWSCGDFVFGGSHLVANGWTKGGSTSVPEPSSVALLGLGLLGMAVGARRKARRN